MVSKSMENTKPSLQQLPPPPAKLSEREYHAVAWAAWTLYDALRFFTTPSRCRYRRSRRTHRRWSK